RLGRDSFSRQPLVPQRFRAGLQTCFRLNYTIITLPDYWAMKRTEIILLLVALLFPAALRAQAATDLAVQSITLPPATVQVGQPIIVEFSIANLGNNGANNFACRVQIFNQTDLSAPVFQNQVNVPNLGSGGSQTLQTTQAWVSQTAGQYVV